MGLRHLYLDSNSTTFADPTNPEHTLRFVRRMQPKKAGTVSLTNINSSIRSLNTVYLAKPEGCTDCAPLPKEVISIRTEISGSRENMSKVAAELDLHIAHLQQARADLLNGFLPAVTTDFVTEVTP